MKKKVSIGKRMKKHGKFFCLSYIRIVGIGSLLGVLLLISLLFHQNNTRVLGISTGPSLLSLIHNLLSGNTVLGVKGSSSQIETLAQKNVKNTLNAVINSSYVYPQDPYTQLGMETSALFQASRLFSQSDPVVSGTYKSFGIKLANELVAHKDDNNDGQVGWGLPYAWDAFGDGTVNPARQVYAYQTGLVGKALVDAYIATHNSIYLQTAEKAIHDYLPFSTTTIDPRCRNCRMFYYSTNKNDYGRFVKNTNMILGMFIGELATVDPWYKTIAQQVYNEQSYEIGIRKNYRYLGYNDPKYSPKGTMDAHLVAEMWGYKELASDLHESNSLLTPMIETFWHCGYACQAKISSSYTPTSIYGAFAGCFFASNYTLNNTYCRNMINQNSSITHSYYPILGMIQYIKENADTIVTSPGEKEAISPTPPVGCYYSYRCMGIANSPCTTVLVCTKNIPSANGQLYASPPTQGWGTTPNNTTNPTATTPSSGGTTQLNGSVSQ